MKLNDEQMLSEVISYHRDFEGELEESMFNWLIARFKELKEENEKLKGNTGTDFDKVVKLFNELGIEFEKTKGQCVDSIELETHTRKVEGHTGVYANFDFKKDGTFNNVDLYT